MKNKKIEEKAVNFYKLFVMPLKVLIIRLQIFFIFNLTYIQFFNDIGPSGKDNIKIKPYENEDDKPNHVKYASRLINGVISELLDPHLIYSRLSFLESGKDAVDIKNDLMTGKYVGFQSYKLPSIKDKYYSQSSIMKNFFGTPGEGSARARYSDNLDLLKSQFQKRTV